MSNILTARVPLSSLDFVINALHKNGVKDITITMNYGEKLLNGNFRKELYLIWNSVEKGSDEDE